MDSLLVPPPIMTCLWYALCWFRVLVQRHEFRLPAIFGIVRASRSLASFKRPSSAVSCGVRLSVLCANTSVASFLYVSFSFGRLAAQSVDGTCVDGGRGEHKGTKIIWRMFHIQIKCEKQKKTNTAPRGLRIRVTLKTSPSEERFGGRVVSCCFSRAVAVLFAVWCFLSPSIWLEDSTHGPPVKIGVSVHAERTGQLSRPQAAPTRSVESRHSFSRGAENEKISLCRNRVFHKSRVSTDSPAFFHSRAGLPSVSLNLTRTHALLRERARCCFFAAGAKAHGGGYAMAFAPSTGCRVQVL